MRKPKYLAIKLAGTFALILAVLAVWLVKMPCPFLALTHYPCPFCGMSRAVFSLMRFDFRAAIAYNFMIFSLPVLYIFFLYDFAPLKNRWINAAVLVSIGTAFLVRWIFVLCTGA